MFVDGWNSRAEFEHGRVSIRKGRFEVIGFQTTLTPEEL